MKKTQVQMEQGRLPQISPEAAQGNYRKAIEAGKQLVLYE